MIEEKRIPEVRFKGFDDAWEQRKFSELVDRVSVSSIREYLPRVEYADIISGQGVLTKDFHIKSNNKKGNEFKRNDILFGYLRPYLDNRLLAHFDGIAVGDWWVLRSQNHNTNFVYNLIQTQKFQVVASLMTGTKMPRANWNTVASSNYFIPLNIEEQVKIGTFFTNFDNLITLHQRELSKLIQFKQAMLRKMFPEKGEKYPRLRFEGFTDAWDQRKLECYLNVSKEKNRENVYSKKDVLSVSGEHGIVNQIEFLGRSFAGASVSNYGIVRTGDIVYTKSPLKSNPYGVIKTNKGVTGIVSTLYAVYRPNKNAFAEFVQVYFEQHTRMNSYMKPLVNKGAKNDMKVSAENALKGKVIFPGYEEQKVISEYFKKLDNLITLQQRKLDSLKNLKKALLQRMFI